jgi:hypothetical protein
MKNIFRHSAATLALLLITGFFAWLTFGASFDSSYLATLRITALIAYAVLLPGFILVITGYSKSRHLERVRDWTLIPSLYKKS